MRARRADIATGELLVVGLLTLAALALRVAGMGQSVFGDELFTYGDLSGRGLADVVHHVAYGGVEDNPPLFYALAELSSQLGAVEVWMRLPSVLLGTATVPLVYAAGRLAAGGRAGLWGALLWVLSPFVLFYGTEGRAYATLAFCVVLSMVALLLALRTGRRRWWALYALAACAAMYSHYTAVFALAAQAGWAFAAHPGARRALLVATGAAALAYVPWLPVLAEQGRDGSAEVIGAFYPVTLRSIGQALARQLAGHPFVTLHDLPGVAGFVPLAAAGLVLVVGTVRAGRGRLAAGPALIAVVALATPLGLLLYGLVGTDIFSPRNLMASIPALCLLLGWLVARLPGPAELAAGGLLAAGLAAGLVMSLEPAHRRPDFKAAAAFIDARAGARDPYVETQLYFSDQRELNQSLRLNLDRPHPDAGPIDFRREARGVRPVADRRAWLAVAQGHRLFVVGPGLPGVLPLAAPPPDLAGRVRREDSRRYPGLFTVGVDVYGPS